jgi:hypothetical protein
VTSSLLQVFAFQRATDSFFAFLAATERADVPVDAGAKAAGPACIADFASHGWADFILTKASGCTS